MFLQDLARLMAAMAAADQAHARVQAERQKFMKRWPGPTGLDPDENQAIHDVIENGHLQRLTAAAVEVLRETWTGRLLLDLPRRLLRIRSSPRVAPRTVDLTPLGWGPKKTLLVGLARPGRPFYGNMFVSVLNRNIDLPSVRVLSRYVCRLRAMMGDDARQPRYIFPMWLDRSDRGPRRGYVIPRELTCWVIGYEAE